MRQSVGQVHVWMTINLRRMRGLLVTVWSSLGEFMDVILILSMTVLSMIVKYILCGFELQSTGECVTLSSECATCNDVWRDVPVGNGGTMREKVKIYNWDGRRYRLLGRERLRRTNDTYVVNMPERFGDRSFTTRYLLYPSEQFVKKHRYDNLLFRAGKNEVWLPVEERMWAEVLFSYR